MAKSINMSRRTFPGIISVLLIALLFLSCDPNIPADPNNPVVTDANIATWNIRILSDGSRDDTELQSIASIFSNFDFVAVQEIRDTTVLNRLLTHLDGWDYVVSADVGNIVKEKYAYFYKEAMFTVLGSPYVLGDPNNIFIREPYIAHFRSGEFDFTVITIHTIYGDTIGDRRREDALLDDVITLVDAANGDENDVLLMGDFNLPSDDYAWQITTHNAIVDPSIKTTITDTSSYDNIWINPTHTSEYADSFSLYKFDELLFGNDDDAALLAVSDHRPVIAQFSFLLDDDLEGDWNTTAEITDPNSPTVLTTGDIRIESVIASPTEDESITIKNYSDWIIDLTPWTLGDSNNPTDYNLPNALGADESKTYPGSTLGFGINDSGEIIYLINDGTTIDTWNN